MSPISTSGFKTPGAKSAGEFSSLEFSAEPSISPSVSKQPVRNKKETSKNLVKYFVKNLTENTTRMHFYRPKTLETFNNFYFFRLKDLKTEMLRINHLEYNNDTGSRPNKISFKK